MTDEPRYVPEEYAQPPAGGTPPPHRLIRASAGAGKTFQLSNQFIGLLAMGAAPQTILATTFTRKAAGEILGRVLLRLARAARSEAEARELGRYIKQPAFNAAKAAELAAVVSRELHRLSVSTIDAFFSRLANSFRFELDLPLEPQMVPWTDPQATRVRTASIEAMIAAHEPATMVDILRRIHHDSHRRSVSTALERIVTELYQQYRLAPDEACWTRLPVPGTLDDEQLAMSRIELEACIQGGVASSVAKSISATIDAADGGNWVAVLGKGIPKAIAEGRDVYSRQPITEALIEAHRPIMVHAQACLLGQIARQTHATWQLLNTFDEHYRKLARAHRIMTFDDLPLKLAAGLAPTSDDMDEKLDAIYYRLDGQIQHLLLDEFQDTSPLQWQIIKPIAQEIVGQEGQPRSFFCVGDIKQSIYGWRGGCAELFDQLEKDLTLPPSAISNLDESYRSSQVVLDAVNTFFAGLHQLDVISDPKKEEIIAAETEKWVRRFSPHTASKELPGYVTLQTSAMSDPADTPDDDDFILEQDEEATIRKPSSHMRFVRDRVRELVDQHPGRSIGVLVRTNQSLNELTHLLMTAGVNASGEGGNPLTDDPAVQLILAALQLADHPGHGVARFHVAHSPLASILHLDPDAPSWADALAADVRRDLAAHGYARLITQWSESLASHGSPRTAMRLSQLIELAHQYDPLATPRPGHFVDFIKATPVEEPASAQVRVMTIHKAKGLEFDIVVLPELHKPIGKVSHRTCYLYRQEPAGDVDAVYRYAKKEIREISPQLAQAHQQEQARRLNDDLCALYVAMTRAIHALHMIIPPLQLTEKGQLKAAGRTDLSPATLLRCKLSEVGDELPHESRILYEIGDPNWDATARSDKPAAVAAIAPQPLHVRLPVSAAPSRSWRVLAPSSLEAGAKVRVEDLLRPEQADGRAYGSLIHAMFQQIQWLNEPLDDERLHAIIQQACATVASATAAQKSSAADAFKQMLAHRGVIEALSSPEHDPQQLKVELWRERPFAVRLDDALVQGVLDRVVVLRDRTTGKAHEACIIDYKTDRLTDGDASPLVARYRPQLQAYSRALGRMLNLEPARIKAALLLPASGRRVEVV